MSLMIISFDAVCNDDLEFLLTQKNFSALAKKGALVRETESGFVTNTYPAHCSVITGNLPKKHGVVENILTQPERDNPDWRWFRKYIKTTTLYDEASKLGLTTCAVLWPVTGGAKIKYNMPEIFAPLAKNRVMGQFTVSLKAGSKIFQLNCLLHHIKKYKGMDQPGLDDFAQSSALYAVRRYKIDLLLLHLTDVDHHKHVHGPHSKEAKAAMVRLDSKLGELMEACPGRDIIVFGDHGCLPVKASVDLNSLPGMPGTYWHHAAGCAFLKLLRNDISLLNAKNYAIGLAKNPKAHIRRFLDDSEMTVSGLNREFALGVEAEPGFYFGKGNYLGQHGYSMRNDHYKTFYAVAGKNITQGLVTRGGSITDIAPLAARLLGIPPWETDGKLNMEVML